MEVCNVVPDIFGSTILDTVGLPLLFKGKYFDILRNMVTFANNQTLKISLI